MVFGFSILDRRHTPAVGMCAPVVPVVPGSNRFESNQNQFELDFHALGSGGGVGEKKAKRRGRAFGAFGLTEEVKET